MSKKAEDMLNHNIGLIGEQSENVRAHLAIPQAVAIYESKFPGHRITLNWISTKSVLDDQDKLLSSCHGLWCVPGSPYQSFEGALHAIRFARENKIPFLGTCGGCQHALLEYARNILGMSDADHEESNPSAHTKIIARLSCSLFGETMGVTPVHQTKLAQFCGTKEMLVKYFCNFGLSPTYQAEFSTNDFVFSAYDKNGEVRAFELREHPFFIGTLFQPELAANDGVLHPLLCAFLDATIQPK